MQCVLQAEMLSSLVGIVHGLATSVNMDCTTEGFHIQCLETDVSLCSFVLDKDGFKSYECLRPVTLGLNVDVLYMVLQQVDGMVSLATCGDVLRICCHTAEKKSSFDMKLMHIEVDQLSVPAVEYQFIVQMPSYDFVRTCRGCCGDKMEITVNNKIQFTSKGDQCSSSATYGGVLKNVGEVSLAFSAKYLSTVAKGAALSKVVVLSMNPDYPLCVEFGFHGGHLQFHLAPIDVCAPQ